MDFSCYILYMMDISVDQCCYADVLPLMHVYIFILLLSEMVRRWPIIAMLPLVEPVKGIIVIFLACFFTPKNLFLTCFVRYA